MSNFSEDEIKLPLRLVIESSPDAVVVHTKGKIVIANPATFHLTGAKSKNELLGRSIMEFIHPDSRKLAQSRIEKVVKTQKAAPLVEEKFLNLKGKVLYGEVVTLPVSYKGVSSCMSLIRDITKRRETEANLRESEEKYKKFFEIAPYGVAVHDGKTVINANPAAVKMVGGRSLKEMVGKPVMNFVHPDSRPEVIRRLQQMVKTGKPVPLLEEKFMRLDGTPVAVEVASTPVSFRGRPAFQVVFSDITERKLAEEALKSAKFKVEADKAQDEALLDSIGEGIVSIDRRGKIIFTNRAAQLAFGKTAEELIGQEFSRIMVLVDEKGHKIPKEKMPLWIVMETGKPISVGGLETPYHFKPNGKIIPIAVTATPVILGKEIIGGIVVFRDVSEEKRIDQSKTEFVSLASHQLLTPISSMKWYLEMVLSGDTGEISEDTRKYLGIIYRSAKRMGELVNALLNVSRIELGTFAVEPVPTDIHRLAQSVVEDFDTLIAHKKIKLSESYKDPKYLSVDQNLMQIVFENLLSNALKYTPPNGTVSVSVGKEGEYFVVKISDTGCGIPQEDQPRIFTKLFRGRNVQEIDPEGTGLGLYIVKSLIEKTGGNIWFESQEGKGTTFFVTIPIEGMPEIAGTRTLIRGSK